MQYFLKNTYKNRKGRNDWFNYLEENGLNANGDLIDNTPSTTMSAEEWRQFAAAAAAAENEGGGGRSRGIRSGADPAPASTTVAGENGDDPDVGLCTYTLNIMFISTALFA